METIIHRKVDVNGISMHVAEKGEGGPVVLLIHGFPELWYSWRHQILGLAARGYHAVAPDLRGFGDTDIPPSSSSYTMFHVVGDIVALIHALGQDKVFVVGHDWGAIVAWHLCMLRPDKVKALVNLSVAFTPRNPARSSINSLRSHFGDAHYMVKFQEPGAAEAEFAEIGTALILKKFLTIRRPNAYILPKETGFSVSSDDDLTLPPWLSEEDINYYAAKFEKTGFTGGLNYYRCMELNWELTAAWTGTQIKVPAKFIVGDLDLAYHFPGVKDYIHKGGFKKDVPFLQDVVVMEGVGHFITLEKAHEVTDHIYDFIKAF
ncbi:Soluble epoxide hydrolase protein [Dioscorea alata]|uniref:Soluble epoxide hydrolase protein n=1 Tax=Dioscorea alata TaxID=55571 RepID=A0ACB7U444_DIOAL|nr:Soluble epoxide hydrolase protein [Dioscorea alata]